MKYHDVMAPRSAWTLFALPLMLLGLAGCPVPEKDQCPVPTGGGVSESGNQGGQVVTDGGDADSDAGVVDLGQGWERVQDIVRGPRQEIGVAAVDATLYVVGGFDGSLAIVPWVEAYDVATDVWRSVMDVPVTMHHANVAAVDGMLFVLGFLRGNGFSADGRVFAYDPLCDEWVERTAMPMGTERGASALAVIDQKIYVAGGHRGGAVSDFSVYDPAEDTWTPLLDIPVNRDHVVGGALDGIFYLVGGRSGGIYGHTAEVWAYDPAEGAFSTRTSMPTSRAGAAAAVLGDRLFILGGEGDPQDPDGVFDEVESYHPATDSWSSHPSLPTKRHGMGAATIDGRIYIPGGADVAAFAPVGMVERYTPAGP